MTELRDTTFDQTEPHAMSGRPYRHGGIPGFPPLRPPLRWIVCPHHGAIYLFLGIVTFSMFDYFCTKKKNTYAQDFFPLHPQMRCGRFRISYVHLVRRRSLGHPARPFALEHRFFLHRGHEVFGYRSPLAAAPQPTIGRPPCWICFFSARRDGCHGHHVAQGPAKRSMSSPCRKDARRLLQETCCILSIGRNEAWPPFVFATPIRMALRAFRGRRRRQHIRCIG